MQFKISILTLTTLFALILAACNGQEMDHEESEAGIVDSDRLIAVIHPTEGNSAHGVVTFTREGDDVRVQATVNGLDPESNHGFHIHEFGDCSADDGTSAGGHFNPHDMPHSGPDTNMRHVGDLGNLEADSDGQAAIDFVDSVIDFDGVATILGRGIVVHAGEDDLETQPTGDAGPRIGCGVIGIAEAGY